MPPATVPRLTAWSLLEDGRPFDLIVVGGGATGLGVALEASAMGWAVLVLEGEDWAQGTSSRSTKLLHGGVRYLAQGRVALVREALHERASVLQAASHLASPLEFVVPSYGWLDRFKMAVGLRLYTALSGASSLGPVRAWREAELAKAVPSLLRQGLKGAHSYWDAQFDDARLAVALMRTAQQHGAVALNHAWVQALIQEGGRVCGVEVLDQVTGQVKRFRAPWVVNAAGAWVDHLRGQAGCAAPLIRPSRGVHVVLADDAGLGGRAILQPQTADGRVMFAIPWMGRCVLGTTDHAMAQLPRPGDEQRVSEAEVDEILACAAGVLSRPPRRSDVRSVWAGIRPLVAPGQGDGTAGVSREHHIEASAPGLMTVTGGKWTTFHVMAKDVMAALAGQGAVPPLEAPPRLAPLVGAPAGRRRPISAAPGEHLYGDEAAMLHELPGAAHVLAHGLTEAMIRFSVRHEMAMGIEDVLARRHRLLWLDAGRGGDRERSLAAGLNEHLVKPIDPEALYAALWRWIPPRPVPHLDSQGDAAQAPTHLAAGNAQGGDAVPPMDGIDVARGLVNHLNRPALYRQILCGFNQEFGTTADDIERAMATGDFTLARRLAHSMKSAAATIGAMELSHCARQLEDSYAQGVAAPAEFAVFVTALRRVVSSVADAAVLWTPAGQSGQQALAVSVATQLALVDHLASLLQADDASAGRVLNDLRLQLSDPRLQGDMSLLRDLIDDVEYDEALKVVARLRVTLAKQPK